MEIPESRRICRTGLWRKQCATRLDIVIRMSSLLPFRKNGAFNFNLCLLRQPEDPTKPVLSVAAEETVETQDWVMPTKVSAITLTNASNQSFTLKGGTAAPFTCCRRR